MNTRKLFLSAAIAAAALAAAPAQAQTDYYLGQVLLLANTYCPRGTREANGDILPIAQNTALFSLYGNIYGGDGVTTFALPDLRGRAANNWGQGPGLSSYAMGQRGGSETVTLTANNLPTHTHAAVMRALAGAPNTDNPGMASFADFQSGQNIYNNGTAPNVNMAPNTVDTSIAGSNMPMGLHGPYLVMRYCVMMQGVFPSRP